MHNELLLEKQYHMNIMLKKAILFGSHAWGRATKDSDIDLAVISSDFSDLSPKERAWILWKARKNNASSRTDMDIACLTPEEFRKISLYSPLYEIKKGISIKSW